MSGIFIGRLANPGGVRDISIMRLSTDGTYRSSTSIQCGDISIFVVICTILISPMKASALPYYGVDRVKEGVAYCSPQSTCMCVFGFSGHVMKSILFSNDRVSNHSSRKCGGGAFGLGDQFKDGGGHSMPWTIIMDSTLLASIPLGDVCTVGGGGNFVDVGWGLGVPLVVVIPCS